MKRKRLKSTKYNENDLTSSLDPFLWTNRAKEHKQYKKIDNNKEYHCYLLLSLTGTATLLSSLNWMLPRCNMADTSLRIVIWVSESNPTTFIACCDKKIPVCWLILHFLCVLNFFYWTVSQKYRGHLAF